MNNPCKECIVATMCKRPCSDFGLYVDRIVFDFAGTGNHYKLTRSITLICTWIRESINNRFAVNEISLDSYNTYKNTDIGLCIRVDNKKGITTIDKFNPKSGAIYESKPL